MTQTTKLGSLARRAVRMTAACFAVTFAAAVLAGDDASLAGGMPNRADVPRAQGSQPPPKGAVVLFNGKDLSSWVKRRGGEPAAWKIENNAMVVGGGDIITRDTFGDFHLHVEFNVPPMFDKRGQARGNSGVYLLGRYEIQVLDSHGPALAPGAKPTYQDCGAVYEQAPPRVNATLAPGEWQTYDITFRAPRLSANGVVREKPRVTVLHNGVTIHDNVAVDGPTRAGQGNPSVAQGPILLQDHGNPVRYRNLWLVPVASQK